jgi:hypothetical protein
VRHAYARILTAAGLRHLKFHGLRHTYAALMLGSGATLTYVRDQMGHKSIQVTADVSGRFIPPGNRSAVNALDDAAQPSATPAQPEGENQLVKVRKRAGEPNFHQLEPDVELATAARGAPARGLSALSSVSGSCVPHTPRALIANDAAPGASLPMIAGHDGEWPSLVAQRPRRWAPSAGRHTLLDSLGNREIPSPA